MAEVEKRRAVVTGASRGIGRYVALELTKLGPWELILVSRGEEGLRETARLVEERGSAANVCVADLTTDAGRQNVLDAVKQLPDKLDLLINNAGVAAWGHFSTSTPELLRVVMDTNFFAPVELIRLLQPMLKPDHATIVNVASVLGRCGLPAWPEQSASKSALVGYTEGIRAEFQRYGIKVSLVVPGMTQCDDLNKHLLRRDGKAKLDYSKGTPQLVVAQAIVEAYLNSQREVWVGKDTRQLLRVKRFLPNFLRRMVARKVRKLYSTETEA